VEVKIGVLHTARELALESDETQADVEAAVTQAVAAGTPLRLTDSQGSVVLVPSAHVAYVEIGAPRRGGVGFGTL
jgi:hypothetical protein